ncbi:MAG: inorganic pyrophosphatase [Erysipelotrichaceae bacterium]|nr:inorganic pyrophosphatase [Erysipelotrichaceae bacterium]
MNKKATVHIDRPIGFNHDGIIYQLNYGYIKELKALDNEYQDAYILGEEKPVKTFEGKVIAVIHRLNDNEDKLVVCNNDKDYSNDEIEKNVSFQEKYFKHKIIR